MCESRFKQALTDKVHVLTAPSNSWNLPDDVFEAGEVKPTRPLKKRPADGTNGAKKRKAPTEVCRDKGSPSTDMGRTKKPWEKIRHDKSLRP